MNDGKVDTKNIKLIGLIDNELCTRSTHSFPNLAIMKLSTYYKNKNCEVRLTAFDEINPSALLTTKFDVIFVSRVFSDTKTPSFIDNMPNVIKGGSGFFYDKAIPLNHDIEHSFPDYNLYSNLPNCKHDYYHKYSIGFITRGCVRQCSFCINKNYKKVEAHSKLSEFVDKKRPFIMLLDDNITAYKGFYEVFKSLNTLNIPFVFKQGMDFRLLNLKKMKIIFESNYLIASKKGSAKIFHYAFDNIEDTEIIEKKLKIYYENTPYAHSVFFYVLTGFDRKGIYDNNFYKKDITDLLDRIKILFKYRALPYIMLHKDYKRNPNSEVIRILARICNFPMLHNGKTMLQALEQYSKISNTRKTINCINAVDPKFLSIIFNNKMYKKHVKNKI